ncbi:MAG: cobalamin-binding protein [Firmicutes bacterium HGW-Firmicutes-21]|nr:MAG: cobalamin-binding protein [Firmicutes bacterium HGW-Firmicutes-21]
MEYYEKFTEILEKENKKEAVEFVLELLSSKKTDVVGLYTEILTPALNGMACSLKDKRICVWKEHVRTAIVRTVVECCYPYVLEQLNRQETKIYGKAVVLCPPQEHHDLGARMVADYFVLCGIDAVFVGSDTPYDDFIGAVDIIAPDFVAISVSNFYNIIVTKKLVEDLRKKAPSNTRIIIGGSAFVANSENISKINADYYAHTFEDIKSITSVLKEGRE